VAALRVGNAEIVWPSAGSRLGELLGPARRVFNPTPRALRPHWVVREPRPTKFVTHSISAKD
jgi:hypothetical protein